MEGGGRIPFTISEQTNKRDETTKTKLAPNLTKKVKSFTMQTQGTEENIEEDTKRGRRPLM